MATKTKKPGFNPFASPNRPKAQLIFDEDHEYAGLEVTAWLNLPAGFMFRLATFDDLPFDEQGDVVRLWGDQALIEWNIVDHEGEPVPATGAGLLTQSSDLLREVWTAWGQARAEHQKAPRTPPTVS